MKDLMTRNSNNEFTFDGKNIRTVVDNVGEVWFVGRDVAEALGYSNPREALREHCKTCKDFKELNGKGSISLHSATTMILERDIYRLVMRSKLPSAERFEEWVVGTVLPTLRKDGVYVQGEEHLEDDEIVLKAITLLNGKLERMRQEKEQIEHEHTHLGVGEFVARTSSYVPHNIKIKLGHRAGKICRERGWPITKQDKVLLRFDGSTKNVTHAVYPLAALEEAFEQIKLV